MDLDDVVRCPRCKGPLAAREGALACDTCRVAYPVNEGIPSFLPDDARPLPDGKAPQDPKGR